jgi:hypothetical protein
VCDSASLTLGVCHLVLQEQVVTIVLIKNFVESVLSLSFILVAALKIKTSPLFMTLAVIIVQVNYTVPLLVFLDNVSSRSFHLLRSFLATLSFTFFDSHNTTTGLFQSPEIIRHYPWLDLIIVFIGQELHQAHLWHNDFLAISDASDLALTDELIHGILANLE